MIAIVNMNVIRLSGGRNMPPYACLYMCTYVNRNHGFAV